MLKKYPLALYLVWIMALIIFPLPLVLILNWEMSSSATSQLLLIDSGLVAYTWWLFEVFLSTRPLWLDRLIGLPATYSIHSFLGIGALLLAFVHRHYLMSMGRWIILTGDWAWYLIIFGIIYAMVFLSGWLVDRLPVIAKVKRNLQFFFKHQVSIWIHRLNLVAILLIWLHVHLIGRINTHFGFMIIFDAYTIVVLTSYLWKHWAVSNQLVVGKIEKIASLNNTVQQITVNFGHKHNLFMPGDYFFVTFPEISKEAHPFSVTNDTLSAPNLVVFTIRELGDYTKQIANLKVGSPVKAEGPFGRFESIVEQDSRPLVLIGLGTGVAPLMSLAAAYHDQRKIHVLWTVHSAEDMFFDEDFKNLENKDFKYHVQVGRLTKSQLPDLLDLTEVQNARFITVGGSKAVLEVEKMLKKIGVPSEHLTDERLTM